MNVDTSRAAAAIVLVVLVYALDRRRRRPGVSSRMAGAGRHGSRTSPRTSGSVRSATTVRFARRRTRELRSVW